MKIIQNAINLFLISWLLPLFAFAQTWEVAVVFLHDSDSYYQRDVDQNILELARLPLSNKFRLGILREFSDYAQEYHADPLSKHLDTWDGLFAHSPYKGIKIPGKQIRHSRNDRDNIWQNTFLSNFLSTLFRDPNAKRILIIYGHGEGHAGLRQVPIHKLKFKLSKYLPTRGGKKPLDILWLNSCFMSNTEAAYELRNLAEIYLASQEAEFSAGAPFDQIDDLPSDSEQAAEILAERYLESYSYLASGSQRKAVLQSSATITALRTEKLNELIPLLRDWMQINKKLAANERKKMQKRLEKWQMEKPSLIDLGGLAIVSKNQALSNFLQIKNKGVLKTNPRIRLSPPLPNAKLMFAYENWQSGFEQDRSIQNRWPITPDEFLVGPKNRKWPTLRWGKTRFLAPFTVGKKRFDFVFLHPETNRPIQSAQWVERQSDFIIRRSAEGIYAIQGYTQGIGANAEKYSGINILNPFLGIPSTDYLDTEFSQDSDWANWQ